MSSVSIRGNNVLFWMLFFKCIILSFLLGLEIPDVEAEKLQTPQCIADMLIKKKEQMMKLDS